MDAEGVKLTTILELTTLIHLYVLSRTNKQFTKTMIEKNIGYTKHPAEINKILDMFAHFGYLVPVHQEKRSTIYMLPSDTIKNFLLRQQLTKQFWLFFDLIIHTVDSPYDKKDDLQEFKMRYARWKSHVLCWNGVAAHKDR